MHLVLRFSVAQPPAQVMAGFTRQLFEQLAPPFPRLKLLRYDGNQPGDVVKIELCAGPKCWPWTSHITAGGVLPDGTHYFVDEAHAPDVPPPLRQWRHRHLVQPGRHGGSLIVEDLQFSTGRRWLDALLLPAMWAQFQLRGPVYRRVFGRAAR